MSLPLRYSFEHLRARRLRSAATASIIAIVVLATTLFMGLSSSIRRTLVQTGSDQNLVVLRKGASNDASSLVTLEDYRRIRLLPGIAAGPRGEPLVSPELVVEPALVRPDGQRENVLVRGIEGGVALEVHDEVHVVAGRMLRPSAGEAIVGRGLAERYGIETLGETLSFGKGDWRIVGFFGSGGSSFESEIWVDVRELANDAHRPHPFSGLRVKIADGRNGRELARRIASDTQASLQAMPEPEYYADQARAAGALSVLVFGLATLAGTAAALGAANALYASVESRRREIGTLRALGFPGRMVLRAFLTESLLMALAGFVPGALLALLLTIWIDAWLGGIGFSITGSTSSIALRVSLQDLGFALGLVTAIAIAGGFFPALRAARLDPASALRR
jgi:putative ABC transport system permease protein